MDTVMICFPRGKRKALTLSYDDGKTTDRDLVELLNEYDVKCTFNINSGLLGHADNFGTRINEKEIATLYQGHEIAIHTYTHPTLPRCSKEQRVIQILEDRKNLEKFVKKTVRGMAYPNVDGFNDEIKDILPHLGIAYARVTGSSMNFLLPKDVYQWQFTCDHRHELLKNAFEFVELAKTQYLYLLSVYGHSMDLEKEGAWDEFNLFLATVSHRDDIWYCTNLEFVDYLNACKNLHFSVDNTFVENPTSFHCWISVNDDVVEIPPGETTYYK